MYTSGLEHPNPLFLLFRRISLSPGLTPAELTSSKVRQVSVSGGLAYVTDLGLGCVFIVELEGGLTRKVRLDRPMGVVSDGRGENRMFYRYQYSIVINLQSDLTLDLAQATSW